MKYKITNLTNDSRKFRIHKTAQGFFIRPGESLIVPHKPIVVNTHILEVVEISDEVEKVEETKKRKKTIKLTKEEE